jgi:hypothetical protein
MSMDTGVPLGEARSLRSWLLGSLVLHYGRPHVQHFDCRLQGGFASPRGSTVGHLSRPYALMAARGVPVRRHVSTTVVSAALAGEAGPDGLTLRPYGGESRSAPTRFPSLRAWLRRRSTGSVTSAVCRSRCAVNGSGRSRMRLQMRLSGLRAKDLADCLAPVQSASDRGWISSETSRAIVEDEG